MSNIFIKIEKDANTVKYIKLIRDYDKTISIGDIKRKIDSGDYVIEFDPFGYSLYDESVKNISEKQYIKRFYKLVQELQKAGAIITVFDEDGDSGGIQFLKRELDMCLDIIAETKRYPD